MNLPNQITITPNEANGAPYLGYEGGEGVVYVPKYGSLAFDLLAALIDARQELRDVTQEFMQEDYNSPDMNVIIDRAANAYGPA